MPPVPADLTPLDAIALAWFLGIWATYNLIQDLLVRGPISLNQHLKEIRVVWMRRMLERENRIMDSNLVGHTLNSVTFFASTTALVLAGLVGVIGTLDPAYSVVQELTFVAKTSREFFEIKLLLLLGIFIYSFFKFTWALRQYNYCLALIGSAPCPPVPVDARDETAENLATAMTLAITSFNGGLRSYYFALAALMWFIQPWLFLVATNGVVVVLLFRQVWSRTRRIVQHQAGILMSRESKRER